jgi:D-arabinose 1-dehydrogenase-like Zn-dependent alcohol dehydrogenase
MRSIALRENGYAIFRSLRKSCYAGRQRTTENLIDFAAGLTNYRVYSRFEGETRKLEEVNDAFEEVESGKAKARLVFDIR